MAFLVEAIRCTEGILMHSQGLMTPFWSTAMLKSGRSKLRDKILECGFYNPKGAKMADERALSLGEKRVRVTFLPTNAERDIVLRIKEETAHLIDLCGKLEEGYLGDTGEVRRLVALARTAYEEAAMWAVKAATAHA